MATAAPKPEILLASIAAQRKAAEWMLKSEALKNAGQLQDAAAAYDELIIALEQRLELNNKLYGESLAENRPIISQLINALLTQADVVEALGDFAKAEGIRNRSIGLSQKYLPPSDSSEKQCQRANSLITDGRFNEALVALSSARDLFEQSKETLRTAEVVTTMAGILEWLGDFARARAEARHALDLIGPLPQGSPPSMSDVLVSFAGENFKEAEEKARIMAIAVNLRQLEARVNRRLGNFEEAEQEFQAVIPHLPANIVEAGIGWQIAAIRLDQGRYQDALDYLARIEPYFKGMVRPKLGALFSSRAEALLGLNRAEEALTAAEEACKELRHYRDADSLWKAEWRRGRALATVGRSAQALAAFVEAVNTVNQLRKAPLGYRLDSTYLKDKLPVFIDGIRLALAEGESETCCYIMELIKSRALSVALSVPDDGRIGASELDCKIDQLSHRLDALDYQLKVEESQEDIEQQRVQLQKERALLLERQRFSDPRWRSLSHPVSFDVHALLELLASRKQAALSLFLTDNEVVSILLADGKCEVGGRQLSAVAQNDLASYRANLQAEEPKLLWCDPSPGLQLTADQLVPRSILEKAVTAKTLIIAPYGILHLLPWSGLDFGGKRLFEYLPIGILPNLSCITALQAELSKSPRIGLIGAPDYSMLQKTKAGHKVKETIAELHLAQPEIETIADAYRNNGALIGEPCIQKNATERQFWSLAKQVVAGGILHVACHGDFVTGDPMSSGLLLADGKIDATELVRRRLACDEVVLSSCSTGQRPTEVGGVTLTGDDIVGLPGALLEAGARSVLVSIPPARDDAAMQFMTIYHDHRAAGSLPLEAAQATQLEMLSNSLYPPELWVGFTVYGCQ